MLNSIFYELEKQSLSVLWNRNIRGHDLAKEKFWFYLEKYLGSNGLNEMYQLFKNYGLECTELNSFLVDAPEYEEFRNLYLEYVKWQDNPYNISSDLFDFGEIQERLMQMTSKSRLSGKPFSLQDILDIIPNCFNLGSLCKSISNFKKDGGYFVEIIQRDDFVYKVAQYIDSFTKQFNKEGKYNNHFEIAGHSPLEKEAYNCIDRINSIYDKLPSWTKNNSFSKPLLTTNCNSHPF